MCDISSKRPRLLYTGYEQFGLIKIATYLHVPICLHAPILTNSGIAVRVVYGLKLLACDSIKQDHH